MRWRDIPRDAKVYMLYHTIIEPQLIVWLLFPLYLMKTGYSILEVGAFFTAVNLASIPLTYVFGRMFNRWDIKKGLIAIDFLDGVAYVLYGFAKGSIAPILLFLGRLFEKLSEMLYPLYRAYEQIIYPRDKYEEIFTWHLRLPEISRLIFFPILGYIFGYIYTEPSHYRLAFLIFGLLSAFTITYIWIFLPSVNKEERISPEGFKFREGEFKLLLAFEGFLTIAWALAPTIVLLNYVIFVLHKTIFEVTLISCASSVATILGTYVSERIPKERGFHAIALGMFINAFYAFVMALSPPFWIVLLVYSLGDFGLAMWFPFYRAWMFRLIPNERVSEFHAAISSYRRVIELVAPVIAGALATLHPTLPYAASLVGFLSAGLMFIIIKRREATQ
ncbi:MFS transporter [Pyrococcus abyssi]|uniref:Major facilitator superfamily permease n=1 Tax=Pyrococcus abyssi (strain GE5 / Orsay) TaxID=272844 RepID=Q9V0C0_PYRAB|nr:MFS transporter [Pyrococcus abyssi]CAB49784.1 Predicted permease [Pyrococcus abyssi GE5]CCE70275.1 TPA: major facilitator superfamily permease [Pyrococcus abyssi GE5]